MDEISKQRRGTDAGTTSWRFPQCPFLIECATPLLDRIRREAECGRTSQPGEEEVGGVLFGVYEPGRICIRACKPFLCEHAFGPGFVLSQKDEDRLAEVISSRATDSALTGFQVLGWYHSHLRNKILLSERDLQLHLRYFSGPAHIALVMRPESGRPTRAGFFFREASGNIRTESSYEEFTMESSAPAATHPRQVVDSSTLPSQTLKPPAKPARPKPEAICPRCGSKHLQRSRRTGPVERLRGLLGIYPYRCHECLSRSFLKTSSGLLERARFSRWQRPEERRRALQRTRREMFLWGGGILGFLAILYFLIRDTGSRQDAP